MDQLEFLCFIWLVVSTPQYEQVALESNTVKE